MLGLNKLNVTAKTQAVLDTLRTNRETHAKIVAEAREGYVNKAKVALEQRLSELKEGKIVRLQFSLSAPVDHTRSYDTAIKMLEMHQEDTIVLTSEQVSCFVMDQWNWKNQWLLVNRAYSGTAAQMADEYDDD